MPTTTRQSEQPVLSRRALNRATLARQLLLQRSHLPLPDAIEHLVGLQAQTPHSWYVGLWTRLDNFDPAAMADLLTTRQAVRIALMRSTIHLVTARDCLALRPLVQPVIERGLQGTYGKRLAGLDTAALLAAGRAIVEQAPRTPSELGNLLAAQWPDHDPEALAQTIRALVPLVQVPPRGLWGRSGPIAHTSAEAWLGQPLATDTSLADLVRRYLAAFGPATINDLQTWSGLTRLREVVEPLRPELLTFRDETGRELFDLPDAPRPDPDIPAPPRFLYDFDNLLLSHADRSRFTTNEYAQLPRLTNGILPGIVLLDGFTAATWHLTQQRHTATLTIRPFLPLSTHDTTALASEAAGLLAFMAPDQTHDLRIG